MGVDALAKRTTVFVSSTESDLTNTKKSKGMWSLRHTNRLKLARDAVADRDNSTPVRPALAPSIAKGPPLSSAWVDFSHSPGQSVSGVCTGFQSLGFCRGICHWS